jgi:arginase
LRKLALIGAALGWGAKKFETEQGPQHLKESKLLEHLQQEGFIACWWDHVTPLVKGSDFQASPTIEQRWQWVVDFNHRLANTVEKALRAGYFPVVLGGDHSIAVGTWSGVTRYYQITEKFGLLWLDAHMDAHTIETTPSQNMHGMPVAALLGYGRSDYVESGGFKKIIRSENLIHLGVRSYEPEEAEFLRRENTLIFKTDDVNVLGLPQVVKKIFERITLGTQGFGISIDLDGFDPQYAPGVCCREPGGLHPTEVLKELKVLTHHPLCYGLEIAEYNPSLDQNNKTRNLIEQIIISLLRD